MPNRVPAIISAILTALLLIVFAVLFLFVQMVALKGASESQGGTAMGISLICQGVVVLLAAGFAGWMSNGLIKKFNWNRVLVVVIAVIVGTGLGGILSFIFTIISIPLAGVR